MTNGNDADITVDVDHELVMQIIRTAVEPYRRFVRTLQEAGRITDAEREALNLELDQQVDRMWNLLRAASQATPDGTPGGN